MKQPTPEGSFGIQQLAALEAARIDPLDITGLLRCLWQGKWLIWFTTFLATLLAGYYAFAIAQPRYAATATLQIQINRGVVGNRTGPAVTTPVNLNTESAILSSHYLLDQVAQQLDLLNDPEFNRYLNPPPTWSLTGMRTQLRSMLSGQPAIVPNDTAITAKTLENLQGAITARAHKDSSVFSITATTGSAEKSIHIANTLAAMYLSDQLDTELAATERAVNWLSEKVFEQQIELARKETAITDLITKAQVTDGAGLDALSRHAFETDQRLREARNSLRNLDAAGEDAALVSTATRPLGDNSRRLRAQISTLEIFRASLGTQLSQQSAGLVQLQQLQRQADATRVLYQTFLTRLQEVNLHRGLQSPDSRFLNAAGPARYVAPRKMLILGIAALLGLIMGVSWTFLRETMRAGFRDPLALKDATGLPVMAQIPLIRFRKPRALLDLLTSPQAGVVQDAICGLRTTLLLAGADEAPQTIICTSSVAGEGKTVLAITLAQNLAGLGKSVLLLDGDQRSDGLARFLDGAIPQDLHTVITGQVTVEAAISRDPRLSVDVITGQRQPNGAADLFCSASFATFMNKMRERYDYIIINAPPVLPVPDGRILAQHADAVVYAVRWNKTPLDLIMAGRRELDNVHAPITGLVMSQVDQRKMRKLGGATWRRHHGAYGSA
jgi:capsular exopolysaccharide synthesis family protein